MKRALAAGALGVGFYGIGAVTSADDPVRDTDIGGRGVECADQPDLALVFAYDYYPEIPFQPVNRLPQETVNAILEHRTNGNPVVSDPTDYHGYVVLVRSNLDVPGEYTFVFVREKTLQPNRRYQFTTDANFFDSSISLLQVGVRLLSATGGMTTREVAAETATETGDDG